SIHRKLKIALTSKEQAADAFQALDKGLLADQKRQLVKQERKAMKEREGNPEAMDVYKIWLASAPSMKSIELAMLSESPSVASGRRGSSSWVAQGLQIQQSQIQLRLEASSAGPQSTELQRLALERKRDWLGMEIQSFVSDASSFIGQIKAQGPEKADQE
ncbi:hypothetical protein PAXRUDRAFT_800533, partial [Paxillus rubicundulus Ve08.2h10]